MNNVENDRVRYEIKTQRSADVTDHHLEHLFPEPDRGGNKSRAIRLSSFCYNVRQKKILHVYTLREEHSLLGFL